MSDNMDTDESVDQPLREQGNVLVSLHYSSFLFMAFVGVWSADACVMLLA